jgi:hypothetical protein
MKFDAFGDLNYLAVLAGTAAYWLLGALWYSPVLFAKPWTALTGADMREGGNPAPLFALTFVLYFATVTALAFLRHETGAANLNDGLQLGLGTSLAFSAVAIAVTNAYERRPFKLTAISAGYHVAGITLAAVIVTLWD